jgi:hypothetical protein
MLQQGSGRVDGVTDTEPFCTENLRRR